MAQKKALGFSTTYQAHVAVANTHFHIIVVHAVLIHGPRQTSLQVNPVFGI